VLPRTVARAPRFFPPATGTGKSDPRFLRTSILGPNDQWSATENVPVSDNLRFVYIFGCDAGKKASQWPEHLAPAQAITYNRWSTAFDHALWFGITGPGLLKNLP